MKNKSLVSLIIPIYSVDKYIEKCAYSLFVQTYSNIQYIFINDCTKDNSIDKLKCVLERFPLRRLQVEIINKDINEGLPQARKTGMYYAKGDYIMHLDSDDWVEPNMVERMLEKIETSGCDVVYSDYFRNSEQQIECRIEDINNVSDYIKKMFLLRAPAQTWNKIYKKELFERIEYPKCNMHEDLYINLQVLCHARTICHIAECFYHYRINPNSITHNYPLEQAVEMIDCIYKYIENNHLNELKPAFYSFFNYIRSFAIKKIRPIDIKLLKKLFVLNLEADKYIFQKNQFNGRLTQLFLFVSKFYIKITC